VLLLEVDPIPLPTISAVINIALNDPHETPGPFMETAARAPAYRNVLRSGPRARLWGARKHLHPGQLAYPRRFIWRFQKQHAHRACGHVRRGRGGWPERGRGKYAGAGKLLRSARATNAAGCAGDHASARHHGRAEHVDGPW